MTDLVVLEGGSNPTENEMNLRDELNDCIYSKKGMSVALAVGVLELIKLELIEDHKK